MVTITRQCIVAPICMRQWTHEMMCGETYMTLRCQVHSCHLAKERKNTLILRSNGHGFDPFIVETRTIVQGFRAGQR